MYQSPNTMVPTLLAVGLPLPTILRAVVVFIAHDRQEREGEERFVTEQRPANVYCKGPDGKYFRFCEPCSLWHNYSDLLLQPYTIRKSARTAVVQPGFIRWPLKFEFFKIIFTCHKIFFFWFVFGHYTCKSSPYLVRRWKCGCRFESLLPAPPECWGSGCRTDALDKCGALWCKRPGTPS